MDWDEEEDGEWEPPLIDNPACKAPAGCGEWKRPMVRGHGGVNQALMLCICESHCSTSQHTSQLSQALA